MVYKRYGGKFLKDKRDVYEGYGGKFMKDKREVLKDKGELRLWRIRGRYVYEGKREASEE